MDEKLPWDRVGGVSRGGGKPEHLVVEGENLHALGDLASPLAGRVDMVYLDPPFNAGRRPFTYRNSFGGHEQWVAFMRERLEAARPLLADDAVLVCAVDGVEVHRAALLLAELFPHARHQMVTTVISPSGQHRAGGGFRRVEEYLLFVMFGHASPTPIAKDLARGASSRSGAAREPRWNSLIRSGPNASWADRPTMHYPIWVDEDTDRIVDIGSPVGPDETVPDRPGLVAALPVRADGTPGRWRINVDAARQAMVAGTMRATRSRGRVSVRYLQAGVVDKFASGEVVVTGRDETTGVVRVEFAHHGGVAPRTVWDHVSHSAGDHGSTLVSALVPGRAFSFPKSLYAVEDTLAMFVADQPDALVLDFFGGSGTTAHAVMRLNQSDGGRRRCVLVTNNEVSGSQARSLEDRGVPPGAPEWEAAGVCRSVTVPRLAAAVTGRTHDGRPVQGRYRWGVESDIADGLEESVAFWRRRGDGAAQAA